MIRTMGQHTEQPGRTQRSNDLAQPALDKASQIERSLSETGPGNGFSPLPDHASIQPIPGSAKPVITVSVRDLLEFVLRTGDLGGEGDFVGPTRAMAGIRGHQWVRKQRPQGYQTEVALAFRVEAEDMVLEVKGRADGLLHDSKTALVEEIKTVTGRWEGVADPLHWAQGKTYAAIYAQQNGLISMDVQLTYLELDSNQLVVFRQTFRIDELARFFHELTSNYLEWARQQHRWRAVRNRSIESLAFPFSRYRPGQRALAVAVYRTLTRGERLFAEAPTGIGKTVSVLFPALKAMTRGGLDKIFFLTAKTMGRTIVEQTFAELRRAG
ncbi:MAG: hypothetical protein M1608_13315, partial [Candidatus Omnitrophica bacterium]|nr:hypothetical protein [Candidatus Omnitrophota bacterium]